MCVYGHQPNILGQVVIVDDGSTDDSVEEVATVLKSFGASYDIHEDLTGEGSLSPTPELGWQVTLSISHSFSQFCFCHHH